MVLHITVWGRISYVKLRSLSIIAQKHCMRILYGDREAYIEKLKTSARRTRSYELQKLDQEFIKKSIKTGKSPI